MTTPKELADKAKQQAISLRDEVWKSAKGSNDVDVGERFQQLHATIDQLQELAEVTDAQRLDWLSANPACTITEEDGKWYVGDFEDLDADGPHNHLRQAIDAAMQKDTQ